MYGWGAGAVGSVGSVGSVGAAGAAALHRDSAQRDGDFFNFFEEGLKFLGGGSEAFD
jgi:hypothetical protein